MTRRMIALGSCLLLTFVLAGRGPSTKEDIVLKAKEAKTRAALEKAEVDLQGQERPGHLRAGG